jgi:probable F420-dependent oxidoreductase
MTAVAGEVADGMICHPFTSERYVREVTLPLIEKALAQRRRKRTDFELSGAPFIATGESAAALLAQIAEVKGQIAFYGSTPAYRGVLDLHGWGPLHEELNQLSKTGQWEAMSALITDEVLDVFAVTGTSNEVAAKLRQRYSGLFDRMAVRFDVSDAELPAVLGALKG